MTINPNMQIGNFLPVPNKRELPELYVLSPMKRVNNDNPHLHHTVIDIQDFYDNKNSLSYRRDRMTGSVKIVTTMGHHQKGTLIDIVV